MVCVSLPTCSFTANHLKMPFHDSVYYPYPEPQGTPSPAGVRRSSTRPPLLQHHLLSDSSSSAHSHHHHPIAMTASALPSASAPAPAPPHLPPFNPRAARESVDWRRVGALDVGAVASELDLDALQQHVTAVAFCSLGGERCPRCRAALDPALAQALPPGPAHGGVLLHCQASASPSTSAVRGANWRAAGGERERLAGRHARLEERARALTGELKQRKRVIRTQQSMLAPRCVGSHKCSHCDKSFLNTSFLQNHLQRRHPNESEIQSRPDNEKKSQLDVLKEEISSLKEQLVQQQQTLQAKTDQEKEQESLHRDLVRELERFKAEEMTRMDRKIEDSRDGFRREMEFFYTRNFQARIEQEHSQMSRRETASSPVQRPPEREQDAHADAQAHAMQRLEQQLRKQDKKWESRLQEIKGQHESEKNQLLSELSRMQSSVGEQQSRGQRSLEEMERRLQERDRTITSQREQIRNISSQQPVTKIVEVPVIVTATPPEPRHKRIVREEAAPPAPPCHSLDPIQEMSEEDRDSSSVSEKRRPPVVSAESRRPEAAAAATPATPAPAPERRERLTPAALRRNPSLRRELRPALELALAEKLEDLGLRPGQSGLKSKELSGILSQVVSARESAAREVPQYWRHREEVVRDLEQRLQDRRRGSEPAANGSLRAKARAAAQASQNRPRSSSLPSRVTQVMSGPPAKQAKTPQPTPRTSTVDPPKTLTSRARNPAKAAVPNFRTPPFSSDEDSEEEEDSEDDDEEEDEEDLRRMRGRSQDPRGRSPQASRPQRAPVVLQNTAGRPSPVARQQTPARPALASTPNQQRAPAGNVVKAAAFKAPDSDDDDWSEVSELQEIDPKRLQSYEDRNGSADKRPAVKQATVRELAVKVENKLAERGGRRPAGGVNVAPKSTKETEEEDVVQELLYTDLEESSDWAVSSLEEPGHILALPKSGPKGPPPTRKSLDSSSTSVWGTSTGKGQKSGVTDTAGAGSTLKSSLISLSDFSDSEDI
ncbi:LOW QUALITY PROTEIN: cilium assembly protein DZIP1 [Gadus macrocephalus]|uniref:LOW QUALITY PROTEIN: cilium assembly protein DZIP1 n=1 Tax=Gadus macrocephalus TaxID=80720 RepID=UPI0028CB7BDA|nr:LOW QUALITY PROTEIN: cilium assembly protein DZIP1 [Gadus macrocephalus]